MKLIIAICALLVATGCSPSPVAQEVHPAPPPVLKQTVRCYADTDTHWITGQHCSISDWQASPRDYDFACEPLAGGSATVRILGKYELIDRLEVTFVTEKPGLFDMKCIGARKQM